jgi:hypothetical protein
MVVALHNMRVATLPKCKILMEILEHLLVTLLLHMEHSLVATHPQTQMIHME